MAAILSQTNRMPEALTFDKKLTQLAPKDDKLRYNLANTLKGLGRLDEAVETFKQAIALNPNLTEAQSIRDYTRRAWQLS